MKKIICLFVLLAFLPAAHADKKKKKGNSGGGGAPAAVQGGGGNHGGGLSGLSQMGQPAKRSGAPPHSPTHSAPSLNTRAPSTSHTAKPSAQSTGKAGGANHNSNPLMRKGDQGASKTNTSNPLTQGKRQAGGSGIPLTKNGASQTGPGGHKGATAGNKTNPNALRNPNHTAQNSRGNNHRAGSGNWQHVNHANYHVQNSREVFHSYHPARHDRVWYTSRYDRVVVVGGGYYYWDAGYWYPAWGYDPAFSLYVYDGPIYSYDNLPPDQVTMNVQAALQDQGYYTGEIDGQVGPKTREALGTYQADHNLEVTSAVDEPTVESLGLTEPT